MNTENIAKHVQFVDPEVAVYLTAHIQDFFKLMNEFVAKMKYDEKLQISEVDLGYCVITINTKDEEPEFPVRYTLRKGRNNTGPLRPLTFYTVQEMAHYILKRWW